MIEAAARQARELRELAQRCIAWHAEGFPISDPHDTYPDDLWAAAARPEAIIAVLDEIDAALSQQAAPPGALLQEIDYGAQAMPPLDTLKIVVREAFMNGLGWMLGNPETHPKDYNEAADWYVAQWVSSEHNPLNYPSSPPAVADASEQP
jgi:hypothetical protein